METISSFRSTFDPAQFESKHTRGVQSPTSDDDKGSVQIHTGARVSIDRPVGRRSTVRQLAAKLEAATPMAVESGQPLPGYDAEANVAVFEKFYEAEYAALETKIRRLQALGTTYGTGSKPELRRAALDREFACIKQGYGQFPTPGGEVDARISRVCAASDHLVYFLQPGGSKEQWLWEGTDPIVYRKAELPTPKSPTSPTPTTQAASSSSPPRATETKGQTPDETPPSKTASPLPAQFQKFYAAKRKQLEKTLELPGSGDAHERMLAGARAEIIALDHQERCIKAGRGWFFAEGRWQSATVSRLQLMDPGKRSERLAIVIKTTKDASVLTWDGGQCQLNEPLADVPPPSGCCTIL